MNIISLAKSRNGVTSLEYAILASILGLLLIIMFTDFFRSLVYVFDVIGSGI